MNILDFNISFLLESFQCKQNHLNKSRFSCMISLRNHNYKYSMTITNNYQSKCQVNVQVYKQIAVQNQFTNCIFSLNLQRTLFGLIRNSKILRQSVCVNEDFKLSNLPTNKMHLNNGHWPKHSHNLCQKRCSCYFC